MSPFWLLVLVFGLTPNLLSYVWCDELDSVKPLPTVTVYFGMYPTLLEPLVNRTIYGSQAPWNSVRTSVYSIETTSTSDLLSPPTPNTRHKTFLQLYSVKVTLVVLYSFVFFAIFIGNSLLIWALALNHEMLTVTNIFLLNLSIADLCVAFFCVYQSLSLYLLSSWVFGDLLCRMYHFIHAMSYTASMCVHMVIAIERYLALVKPFWARVLLTKHRLRLVMVGVWTLSAVACFPRFLLYKTITIHFPLETQSTDDYDDNEEQILCVISHSRYNPKIYDICYITLCFAIPLTLIGLLYFRISFHLWQSTSAHSRLSTTSREVRFRKPSSVPSSPLSADAALGSNNVVPTMLTENNCTDLTSNTNATSSEQNRASVSFMLFSKKRYPTTLPPEHLSVPSSALSHPQPTTSPHSTGLHLRQGLQMERLLRKRRKVIKLMIVIVLSFALFSVPFHLRKLLQHFCPSYNVASDYATMFTLATTLLLYANSAVNPLLYMCFSAKIRRLMLTAVYQLLCRCSCRRIPPGHTHSSPTYSSCMVHTNKCSNERRPLYLAFPLRSFSGNRTLPTRSAEDSHTVDLTSIVDAHGSNCAVVNPNEHAKVTQK